MPFLTDRVLFTVVVALDAVDGPVAILVGLRLDWLLLAVDVDWVVMAEPRRGGLPDVEDIFGVGADVCTHVLVEDTICRNRRVLATAKW